MKGQRIASFEIGATYRFAEASLHHAYGEWTCTRKVQKLVLGIATKGDNKGHEQSMFYEPSDICALVTPARDEIAEMFA